MLIVNAARLLIYGGRVASIGVSVSTRSSYRGGGHELLQLLEQRHAASCLRFNAAHAAACTARHGVAPHPCPARLTWTKPAG